jgi:hypothetical protein
VLTVSEARGLWYDCAAPAKIGLAKPVLDLMQLATAAALVLT